MAIQIEKLTNKNRGRKDISEKLLFYENNVLFLSQMNSISKQGSFLKKKGIESNRKRQCADRYVDLVAILGYKFHINLY